MKKFLWAFITVNFLLLAILGSLLYLGETYPFQPCDPLYTIQKTAEQARMRFKSPGIDRVEMALILADRRLMNLAEATGPVQIKKSISEFDNAFKKSFEQYDGLPKVEQEILKEQFKVQLKRTELIVSSIEEDQVFPEVTQLKKRIVELSEEFITEEIDSQSSFDLENSPPTAIQPVAISFLENEIDHSVYHLEGAHVRTECSSCHIDGIYAETPTDCNSCHTYKVSNIQDDEDFFLSLSKLNYDYSSSVYPQHFEGNCDDCHSVNDWYTYQFNHEGILECHSCHQDDRPTTEKSSYLSHLDYPAQCIDCHEDMDDWMETFFDHEVAVDDCNSCHEIETPDDHYTTECDYCHIDVDDWNEYEFIHNDLEGCEQCHGSPERHVEGLCSSCHRTSTTWMVESLDHAGLENCIQCHTSPVGHPSGNCQDCHTTSSWSTTEFDHRGSTDCIQCHSNTAPANHYGDFVLRMPFYIVLVSRWSGSQW